MSMNYSEIYLADASFSTIAVAGLLVLVLMYVLEILYDIKRLSKIAKRETEIIARGIERGASIFGGELSNEATGFAKTVFALLLSHFAEKTKPKSRKKKIKIKNQ